MSRHLGSLVLAVVLLLTTAACSDTPEAPAPESGSSPSDTPSSSPPTAAPPTTEPPAPSGQIDAGSNEDSFGTITNGVLLDITITTGVGLLSPAERQELVDSILASVDLDLD